MADEFKYDVFLSHSAKDKAVAQKLAQRLKADGLRVWFDEWDIKPGDNIPETIESGLRASRVLVLGVSKNYPKGERMASQAISRPVGGSDRGSQRIIPVRLDDSEMPDLLQKLAWIDWKSESPKEYSRLLAACLPARPEALAFTLHELRVPLVAFRACIERLQHEVRERGYHFTHDYLADLEGYSDLMRRLLQELEIMRIGPERIQMNVKRVFLAREVVLPAIRFTQALLRSRGFDRSQISLGSFEELPPLFVDPLLMTQVMFNLLDNAIKYHHGRPDTFRVEVQFKQTVQHYQISVADFGCGVPLDLAETIFVSGYRAPQAETFHVSGAGLGLSIAREIVRRHGGDLILAHAAKPTIFTISLPRSLALRAPGKTYGE